MRGGDGVGIVSEAGFNVGKLRSRTSNGRSLHLAATVPSALKIMVKTTWGDDVLSCSSALKRA